MVPGDVSPSAATPQPSGVVEAVAEVAVIEKSVMI